MTPQEITEAFDRGADRWADNGRQQQTLELFWAEELGIEVEWPEGVKH